jgi:hypothetical protein
MTTLTKQDFFTLSYKNNCIDEVKKMFCNQEIDSTFNKNEAIKYTALHGYHELLQLFLSNPKVNPSDNNNVALIAAAKYGETESVRILLNHPKIKPAANDNWAIRYAANRNHLDIVKLLWNNPIVKKTLKNNCYHEDLILFKEQFKEEEVKLKIEEF